MSSRSNQTPAIVSCLDYQKQWRHNLRTGRQQTEKTPALWSKKPTPMGRRRVGVAIPPNCSILLHRSVQLAAVEKQAKLPDQSTPLGHDETESTGLGCGRRGADWLGATCSGNPGGETAHHMARRRENRVSGHSRRGSFSSSCTNTLHHQFIAFLGLLDTLPLYECHLTADRLLQRSHYHVLMRHLLPGALWRALEHELVRGLLVSLRHHSAYTSK